MSSEIYRFDHYNEYLLSIFGDKSERRGLKSKAAIAIGVHSTMISQLLHGKVLLNLEQAEKLNRFLEHDEDQSHYFLLLTQKARAGTKSLESYFQKQIDRVKTKRLNMKKRVGTTDLMTLQAEQKYYSSWLYAALHVAVSIPALRTPAALAKHFHLSISQTKEVLDFLLREGLVQLAPDGLYSVGARHLHLGSNSPHIQNHHRNWRLKTLQALENHSSQSFHYSAAVTLSHDDVLQIKEQLIESLKRMNKTIQGSAEETVHVLSFDFFEL